MEEIKNINKQNLEGWFRRVDFTVPKETWEKEFDAKIKNYRKDLSVPGFRKGKAPLNLIKAKYGKLILNEVEQELAKKYTGEINKSENLNMIEASTVFESKLLDNEDMEISLQYEEEPNLKGEVNYKGFTLFKTEFDKEKEIEDFIKNNLEKHASAEEKPEDSEIEDKDVVSVFIETYEIGEDEEKKVKDEEITVNLGKNIYDEEFEKELIGHKKGDELSVNRIFVDDKDDIEHKVKINKISSKKIPALTEEFIKENFKFVSDDINLENYKEKIGEYLQKQNENSWENLRRVQIESWLLTANQHTPPTTILRYEIAMEERRRGFKFQDLDENTQNRLIEQLSNRIVLGYIIDAIGEEEQIEADKDEVNEFIQKQAEAMGRDFSELRREIIMNKQYENIKNFVAENKVFTLIEEKSELEIVPQEEFNNKLIEAIQTYQKEHGLLKEEKTDEDNSEQNENAESAEKKENSDLPEETEKKENEEPKKDDNQN